MVTMTQFITIKKKTILKCACLTLQWSKYYFLELPWWLSGKNLPAMQKIQVQSLSHEDPLEKEMATHSGVLAWEIPWMGEHGRLPEKSYQKLPKLQNKTHILFPQAVLPSLNLRFLINCCIWSPRNSPSSVYKHPCSLPTYTSPSTYSNHCMFLHPFLFSCSLPPIFQGPNWTSFFLRALFNITSDPD